MRSTSKTVLYTITGVGATSKKTPVAIFANWDKCRPFAVHVMNLHKAGDVEALKALELGHLVTEEGKVAEKLRFTRVTLPYEPELASADVDPFAEAASATS